MVHVKVMLTALLLCVATVVVSAANAKIDDSAVIKPYPIPQHFCLCPKGYVIRYYKYRCECYKFVRDLASWAEAKVYCGVMRARMVEVKDGATHTWLRMQLYYLEPKFHHHLLEKAEYWLAATDLEVEKHWKWDPSNTAVVPGYEHWLPNEPNNYLGYQNCMAIRRRCWDAKCIDYSWFDDDCYQKKFYICKRRGLPIIKPVKDELEEKKA